MILSPLFLINSNGTYYVCVFKKNINLFTNHLINMLNMYPIFLQNTETKTKFIKRFLDEYCIYKIYQHTPNFNTYIFSNDLYMDYYKIDTNIVDLKVYNEFIKDNNAFDHYKYFKVSENIKTTNTININLESENKTEIIENNVIIDEFIEKVLPDNEIEKYQDGKFRGVFKYSIINIQKLYNIKKTKSLKYLNETLQDYGGNYIDYLISLISIINSTDENKFIEYLNKIKFYYNKYYTEKYSINIFDNVYINDERYKKYLRFRYELVEIYYYDCIMNNKDYGKTQNRTYSRIAYLADNKDLIKQNIISITQVPKFDKDEIEKYGDKNILPNQIAYKDMEMIEKVIEYINKEELKKYIKVLGFINDNINITTEIDNNLTMILDNIYINKNFDIFKTLNNDIYITYLIYIILIFVKASTINYSIKYYLEKEPNENNSYIFIKMASSSLGLGIVISRLLREIDDILDSCKLYTFKQDFKPLYDRFISKITEEKEVKRKAEIIINIFKEGFIFQEISRGMCPLIEKEKLACYNNDKYKTVNIANFYSNSLNERDYKETTPKQNLTHEDLINKDNLTKYNVENITCINKAPIKMRIFLFCMWKDNDLITFYPDILNFEELIPIENKHLLTDTIYNFNNKTYNLGSSYNRYVSNNLSSLNSVWNSKVMQNNNDLSSLSLLECYNKKLIESRDKNGFNYIEKFNISLNKTMANLLKSHIEVHNKKLTKYSFYKNTIGLYCIDVVLANDDKILDIDENIIKIIDINNFGAFMNPQITPYYVSLLQKLSDDNIQKDIIINKDNIILFKNYSQLYPNITTYICKNKGIFSEPTKPYENKYLKYKQKYLNLQKLKN